MRIESQQLLDIQQNSGFNKQNFAQSLGITSSKFSKYIGDSESKGAALDIPLSFLRKLREVYNIDLNEFVLGEYKCDDYIYIPLAEKLDILDGKVRYMVRRRIPILKSLTGSCRIDTLKAFTNINTEILQFGYGDIIIYDTFLKSTQTPRGLCVVYKDMIKVKDLDNNGEAKTFDVLGKVVAWLPCGQLVNE